MKRLSLFLLTLIFAIAALFLFVQKSSSDELDDLNKQINELTTALNMSINATKPLESELRNLQKQIEDIKKRVFIIEADVSEKKRIIDQGYEDLARQEVILGKTIRNYYIKSYYNSPFLIFLSSQTASEITQQLAYQKAATDQDKLIITNIALSISDLEEKKKNLQDEQSKLTALKATLDEQSAKLDQIVQGAKAYQSSLSSKIAQLSAKQQEIIAQKLGSLNISRSAYSMGRCDSDLTNGRDPGFSPKFAFFTYGVPHRNGMNQYGAWGRAKTGQNEEQILQEYYPNMTLKKDYDQGVQIITTTGWSGTIEEYVKRIYEVPDSWTDNNLAVLKAQTVAARSYALNSMKRNGSICTSESCQVFKPEPKGGNWEQAAEATKGWVLMDGGDPGFTQYASTHGGYILNLGKFDGIGGNPNSFSELNERAYDKDSPWFYCDWGSRPEYNKTAWLKTEEIADIANVILLARRDSSLRPYLYQTDKPNPEGKETWSKEKVKQELGSSAFNSISNISISADFGIGRTTNVTVSGDGKSESFNGSEFKDWFNLRASANIQIVGPLYNIEKR